jgi:ribosomal protein S18 acetylase RimI-like enzyme
MTMAITYGTELASIDGYWSLFESTGWNRQYRIKKVDLATVLERNWYMVTAYDGQSLVGIGRIVSDGLLHAIIYDLITDPGYRGKGIGTEILRRLVARCREARVRDIQLFCADGAQAFYEKRGFRARVAGAPGMEYVPPASS